MATDELINRAKYVYQNLCDQQSCDIFLNRLLWNITGEPKYIEKIFIKKLTAFSFTDIDDKVVTDVLKKIQDNNSKHVIIYGAGFLGEKIAKELIANGVSIKYFWDKSKEKQATLLMGLPVKEPFSEELTDEFVLIGTGKFSDEIYDYLILNNVAKDRIISPAWLIRHLDEENTYFAQDIIEFVDDEVFIDGGSFNFGTGKFLLQKAKGKVKKIYTFEPEATKWDEINTEISRTNFKNVELVKAGLWSKKDRLYFNAGRQGGSNIDPKGSTCIDVESLDDMRIPEKVTFIKMDIEGAELEALKGAQVTIKRDRPKLAICIYHKPNDIIDIPFYIKSLVPEYQLYIRHYSDYESESVLYAVIK